MSQDPSGGRPLTASVEKLRHELDRWLDVAWTQGERALDAIGLRESGQGWVPRIDIVESPDKVCIFVDVPGVVPDVIEVSIAGNMLTIQGNRLSLETTDDDTVHLRERSWGEFKRAVPLPVSVDTDEITAEANQGVLKISIAKTEAAKPKKIEIKSVKETSRSKTSKTK